ncbi:TrmH family RNA methyltransferase [Lysobacter sp. TAB13]
MPAAADAPPHHGGHAHPHDRSERREQRHRHGDDVRDTRERGHHDRPPRAERAYRERDDEFALPLGEDGFDSPSPSPSRARRDAELRLYGINAIRAVFARRPEAIRKLYLDAPRIPQLQPLLSWCVANRVGYRVVESQDLDKLAASGHHEGVVADVLREEPVSLSEWLRDLGSGPQLAIWLDGVGNPHNLGAILRSSAHFGVSAVLLPKDAQLSVSGAAARVAEGGAEAVPMVRMGRTDNALAQLRSAGFVLAATVVSGGEDVFAATLPQRLIYVLGAEGAGMDRELAAACDLRLSIPGSGKVESLNVAAATAVLLAAWKARR